MFTFAYHAAFNRDDGRLLISFPDFPSAHTDGVDANEAMEEAIDCLGSSIAFAMADKVNVPPLFVRRMLDPNHDTRPQKIQAALEALGKRVVMAYDDAA